MASPVIISINHNVAYLASTKLVFNYDPTKNISNTTIVSQYADWTNASKDINDSGNLTIAQGTTGGRPDIGPYTDWTVRWLYTGDYRMKEQSFGNADLSGNWPVHFREGNSSKNIQGSFSGIGKIISIRNRPTIRLSALTYNYTLSADRVNIVGNNIESSWTPDCAHHPDLWSPVYMLTGDYWYLEELFYWASWSTGESNGAAYDFDYGRGPTGAEGGIPNVQVRQQAWAFRTRIHAASLTPDSFAEKIYFETLIDDAIAAWEGARSISGTSYTGNSIYNWGALHYKNSMGIPPLHQWDQGFALFAQTDYGIDITFTEIASSNFEQHFMMLVLGRAKELGYASESLVNFLSRHYIDVITNEDYNPYLLGNGRVPSTKLDNHQYITSYDILKLGYDFITRNANSYDLTDAVHGYAFLGMAASSMISGAGSAEAWEWCRTHILNSSVLNNNPKWAIIHRGPFQNFRSLNRNNKIMKIKF